jgi:hypothetical protein
MPRIRRPRAFGGGGLKGHDVVRLVYFDESGISNIREEPHLVVAGVISEPDRVHRALEAYLAQLALDWVPKDKADSFVCFHATELFSGGKTFTRPEWPIEKTLPIIKRIVRAPVKFDLPVVYGVVDRDRHLANHPRRPAGIEARTRLALQQAFMLALIRTNAWMRKHARREELAMVIVEDNTRMREVIKKTQTFLQYPSSITPMFAKHLPLERIIESVLFADKSDSDILQVSDMCAYVIKRAIGNKPHSEDLFGTIVPKIHWGPLNDNDPVRDVASRMRERAKGIRLSRPF